MRRLSTCLVLLVSVLLATIAAGAEEPASYYVVHFSAGPSWDEALPPAEQKNFAGHSANLQALREDGVIVFGARYEEYGMVIVRAGSLEEASDLFADDPGVRAGSFVYAVAVLNVFFPWQEGASR